jgi:hypothetical protein
MIYGLYLIFGVMGALMLWALLSVIVSWLNRRNMGPIQKLEDGFHRANVEQAKMAEKYLKENKL